MTEDKFQSIKKDLFAKYGKFFCEEAKAYIAAAEDITALIAVLQRYAWDTWHKDFTAITWLRKWFADELEVFNENGCYLDQSVTLTDSEDKLLMFFGKCFVNIIVTEPVVSNIYLHDETQMNIYTRCVCSVNVYTKNKAQCHVLYQHHNSTIKIRQNK